MTVNLDNLKLQTSAVWRKFMFRQRCLKKGRPCRPPCHYSLLNWFL